VNDLIFHIKLAKKKLDLKVRVFVVVVFNEITFQLTKVFQSRNIKVYILFSCLVLLLL